MAADQKYRAACAEANPSVGGAEERLLEELASIHAQVAAEEPEVKSAESRVQRYEEPLNHGSIVLMFSFVVRQEEIDRLSRD